MEDTEQIQQEQQPETHEADLGIECYLSEGSRIEAILKFRFSDFIVNEIEAGSKQVLFLDKGSSIDDKTFDKEGNFHKPIKGFQNSGQSQNVVYDEYKKVSDQDLDDLCKVIGETEGNKVRKFYDDYYAGNKNVQFYVQVPKPEETEKRFQIHEFVRNRLVNFDSKTENGNIVIFFSRNTEAKRQKRSTLIISCILMKSGIDTGSACWKISNFLKVPPKSISYAGIKDKRGITTQQITVQGKFNDTELKERVKRAKLRDIQISSFKVVENRLRVGDLYGNRFSLVLRLLENSESLDQALKQNFEGLSSLGFINYYGTQRFGAQAGSGTHNVGALLLQKKYKEAFEAILTTRPDQKFYKVLEEFKKTYDVAQALKDLPKHLRIERQLLESYKKNGQNHRQSILSLPRGNRDLYIHALQSYIWNKLASWRIKKYGKELRIGDIVSKDRQKTLELQMDGEDVVAQENQNTRKDEDEQQEIAGGEDEVNLYEDKTKAVQQGGYQGIHQIPTELVTAENIAKYSIDDVVIPIFGTDSQFDSSFNLYEPLKEVLNELQITIDSFSSLGKEFFAQGGYRLLIGKAEQPEFKIFTYDDKKIDLVGPYYNTEKDQLQETGGKYKACLLRFSLQKGCYATMAIREMTKSNTSFENQVSLNKKYEEL